MSPQASSPRTPDQQESGPQATGSQVSKRLVVCADDFGMDAAVSRAILELAESQRISATSVLVFAGDTARSAPLLAAARPASCSIGLHFTLTEFTSPGPLRPQSTSLPALIVRAGLRLLNPTRIRGALRRQLDRFEELFGTAPDFVDGHEHVHQLPVIRDVVVDSLCERYGSSVAVRSTRALSARGSKARVIAMLGGNTLARVAPERGLTTNVDFAGVYPFDRSGRYRRRVLEWLENVSDGGLIMCHPGADRNTSSIAQARHEEYNYLRSPEWPADLAVHGARLVPFRGVSML